MIHIGNLIREELRRQGRSVGWFAEKLCCDRTNVYDIFKRGSLDTALLLRISRCLQHDFFQYYTSQIASEGHLRFDRM
ncbi:MAG: XRE family transcriptional regulator [Rikenellaceae bacterium]|nr:XRE family transcriptional regulator [Rikenellaceae bacterium]